MWTDRAVQTQHDDHEEEDDGEEGGCGHVGDGLGIDDEQQTGACREERRGTVQFQ